MVVILHNIRSIHNVGSIFRTADAAGVDKIYLCGITPEPVDRFGKIRPQLAKVALGAEKTVAWRKYAFASRLIDKLKQEDYKILAIEQSSKSIPYHKFKIKNCRPEALRGEPRRCGAGKLKIALVLGNEVRGLSRVILKKCDKILEIPMRGAMVRQVHHPRRVGRGKESLNVTVAFGIVAFHLNTLHY